MIHLLPGRLVALLLSVSVLACPRVARTSPISIDRSFATSTVAEVVTYHWRSAREMLTLAVENRSVKTEKGRRGLPIPTGPLVETAFEHWLAAFEAAPYFMPLVDDLSRRQLLPDLVAYCRKNREGPRRRACLLALCACQPDPLRRLSPLREYATEFKPFGLFGVWYASALIDLHVGGHRQPDNCFEGAIRQLERAFEINPLEEAIYERMLRSVATKESLFERNRSTVSQELTLATEGFYHLMSAEQVDPLRARATRDGLLGRARDTYRRLLKLTEKTERRGTAWYFLALEAFRRGAHAEALDDLERVRETLPRHPQVIFLQGRACMELGRLAEAERLFMDLLQFHVEPGAWHNVGSCRMKARDPAGARAAYMRGLALDPFYSPTLLSLAALEIQAKREAEARPYLETLVSRNPASAQGLFWLGMFSIRDEEIERAQEFLQSSLRLAPTAVPTRVNLANILARREEYDRAVEVLMPILSLPGAPFDTVRERLLAIVQARLRRAIEWERKGKKAESRHEFEAIREFLGPPDRPAPPFRPGDTEPILRLVEPRLQ